MWRSEPQMPDASTFTTASSEASGSGSGRSSSATLPGSWKVTACIAPTLWSGRRGRECASPEQRRHAVALLAQRVEYRDHVLRSDRAPPLDRPARVVQPERHARVDVVRRPDPLADRERRLVHQLGGDPAQYEPGRVGDPLAVEAECVEEPLDLIVVLAGKLHDRAERRNEV